MNQTMKRGGVTLLLLAVGCSSGSGGSPGTGGAGGRGGAAGGGAGTGGSATAGAAGTATGGSAGGAAWLTPPTVPATLAVPTGATLAIHDHAVGQQVYTCTAISSGGAGGGAGGAGGAGTSYAW